MEKQFAKNGFLDRVKSMLKVDCIRTFTSRFFYIMVGISLVMPVLILVMTTMMDGSVSVNPQTGAETVMEGFDYAWQAIGSLSGGEQAAAMDITSMCNINLIFFAAAVLVCCFIADDFRSGYAKNLFTVRANKADYVFSKSLVGFLGGGCMLVGYFLGTLVGGAVAGLPFTMDGFTAGNLLCCMLSKIALMGVFVGIYTLMSIIAKQRLWLSMLLSFGVGAFLFMMISSLTPLNANFLNVLLCLVGGVGFSVGLGAIGCVLLRKRDIL